MTFSKTFVRFSSVLLAVVLSWGGLASNVYADADSISINFGPQFGAPTGGDLGAVPVNWQYWNNAISTAGIGLNQYTAAGDPNQYNKAGTINNQIDDPEFFTSNLISNTGADTGLKATWSCNNTYRYGDTRPSTDNNAILFYGYLDDSSGNQRFNMTAPYFTYDIYYYATTDSNGYRYATINSVNYQGNGSQTVPGTGNWGTLVRGDLTELTEGKHYLKVSSSDSAITISGVGIDSSSSKRRGSFGAVQVVNTANSLSTTTTETSLTLSSDSISWNNDLTGATGQSFDANAFGYRIIYTGAAIDTFTVDLNGATSLPNIKLIGSATNLAFSNVNLTQLGETGKVLDLSGTGANVTLPAFTQIAKQGVVKFGSNVTFTETPANQSFITGAYFADPTTSFACIQDGVVKKVETTSTVAEGANLLVTAVMNDHTVRTLNSLITQADYKNNQSLTLTSGMITLQTNNHWVQGGGTITSGYRNADGEYDLYICGLGSGLDMRIDKSTIIDNPGYDDGETVIPAGKVNVIKTGVGRVSLSNATSANTYSGKTMVLEGMLQIGEAVRSTEFYVAGDAQLDFSSKNYKGDVDFPDVDHTATSLSGNGTIQIGNSNNKITLTLDNVANDGSKFARVNAYGKALTLNNSELHASYVDNNSVITLNNSTLVADTLNGSATSKVVITGDSSSLNVPTISGTVTLEIPENETRTFNTAIGGEGALAKAGAGTLELTANNTYSGNTQINGGVLDLTNGAIYTGGYFGNAHVYVNDGGTLKVNNFGYSEAGASSLGGLTYSSNGSTNFHLNGGTVQIAESFGEAINRKIELQTNGGTFDLPEGVELTLGSDVHGAGGLTKAGAGTLTLTLQPAYTGATTISAGKLITTAGGTLYNLSGVASATLDNNGQAITVNNSADTVFSGTITGAGSFTKTGSGKLEITNKMAYTGDTTVSAGTLQLNDAAGGGKFFQGTVTIAAGATLKCSAHDTLGYNSDEKVFNIYGTLDNAYKNESLRNTTLNLYGGTICSTDTTNGGQLDILNKDGTSTGNKIFTYALEGATAANPTVSTISSKINLRTNGTLEINTAANSKLLISGVISKGSDSCTITKLGAGTLTLSAQNTYTAGAIVKEGTLELTRRNQKAAFPKGSTITVDGATAVLAGNGDILGYTSGAIGSLTLKNGGTFKNDTAGTHITVNSPIYMNNGIITAVGAGRDGTYSFLMDNAIHVTGGTNNKITALGFRLRKLDDTPFVTGDFAGLIDVAQDAKLTISSIIDSGSSAALTKAGAGELIMTSANAYTTGTKISQGTLTLKESGALGTGAVAIAKNAVLNLNHDGAARFDNSVTGVEVDSEMGYGKIYKNGNGVLKILNNDVDGFVSESFVVNAGKLDFKGYFKGALEIGEDAVFSPGNSIGTLTIDGTEVDPQMSAFALGSGATLLMEVGYDENNVWTSDQLIVNGPVSIDPESTIIITLLEGTALPSGTFTLDLISGTGATEDVYDAVLSVLSVPYFKDYSVTQNDDGVIQLTASIDFNAVPEPSTWALLALGALGLLYWRRKNA